MSAEQVSNTIPKGAIRAAGALVIATVLTIAVIQVTGYETSPNSTADSQPVQSVSLTFQDLANGGILVRNAETGAVIDEVAPETNGFIRGALRGLMRDRKLRSIGRAPAFELVRWDDGRLSLTDTATGTRIYLAAYGPTNHNAFAQFLSAGSGSNDK
jgi:putative photosynthetic complex assembly protein